LKKIASERGYSNFVARHNDNTTAKNSNITALFMHPVTAAHTHTEIALVRFMYNPLNLFFSDFWWDGRPSVLLGSKASTLLTNAALITTTNNRSSMNY